MQQQDLIKKLADSEYQPRQDVLSTLTKPILNPLTEEERELAIAIAGCLKTLDHSWKIQCNAATKSSLESEDELVNESHRLLMELPKLMHEAGKVKEAEPLSTAPQ